MDKISIVCATYLKENDKYLRLVLESVQNQSYKNFEFILISSGEHIPQDLPSWVKHIHHETQHHYPEAINSGVAVADEASKYYLICNDDIIFSKNSIQNMIQVAGDGDVILNPISNCDNHWRYVLALGAQDGDKFISVSDRFYKYEDLQPYFHQLMNAESLYPTGAVSQEFVCFYATLFPKKVWKLIGGLDANFKTGQDDVDCSLRARQLGVQCGFVLNSLIWHFGGKTADVVLTPEIRDSNLKYYKEKWGHDAP